MIKKFNPSISIIRVLAMVSIIIGHWLTMKGIEHFQYGAIGVQIFLFISGYLQRDKQITHYGEWFKSKWARIIAPYYIGLFIIVLLRIIFCYKVNLIALIVHIFNMQGIGRLFSGFSLPVITGYGHTWFLTVIVVCYLFTAVLKKFKFIENKIRNNPTPFLILSVITQIILSALGIQIGNVLCYFYGYFIDHDSEFKSKKYWSYTILVVLATAFRFGIYLLAHDSFLYQLIFAWSFIILGTWISVTIMKICNNHINTTRKIAASKPWRLVDVSTYALFLTHYMFLKGDLSVEKWVQYPILQAPSFLVCTIISSTVILLVTERNAITNVIRSRKEKEG